MPGNIIGLGYRALSGKDTVGNYICKEYNFQRISFAEPLKRACMEIFGWTEEHVYGSLKEVVDPYWGFTPRFGMQKVGTDLFRDHFDREIWVKAAGKKIYDNPDVNWVFTDCRFPNEAKAIKDWGGIVVRIDRPQAGASGGVSGHESETAMEKYNEWDAVIDNKGQSLDNLYKKVDTFMKSVENGE